MIFSDLEKLLKRDGHDVSQAAIKELLEGRS